MMRRFLYILMQTLALGLMTVYFFGLYPAMVTVAIIQVAVHVISNRHMNVKVIGSPVNWMEPFHRPLVIASKCASSDATENTIGAAKEVIRKGGRALHFQVRLTSDRRATVFGHDELAGKSNGSGQISHVTYSFVALLSALASRDKRKMFSREKIPRMDEMLSLCLKHSTLAFVELVGDPNEMMKVVYELCNTNEALYKSLVVISDQPYLIYLVRRNVRNILTGLIYRGHEDDTGTAYLKYLVLHHLLDRIYWWWFNNWLWYLCGNSFVIIDRAIVSESMVKHYRRLGVVTIVGPVRRTEEKEYFTRILECPVLMETVRLEDFYPDMRAYHLDNMRLKASERDRLCGRNRENLPKVTHSSTFISARL